MFDYYSWDDSHLDSELSIEFAYTKAYQETPADKLSLRELRCISISLPASLLPVEQDDWFAGRRVYRPLGVAPSYWNDQTDGLDHVSYYADIERLERVMNRPVQTPEKKQAISGLIEFWKKENVNAKVRNSFDRQMAREMPSDLWNKESGVIFGLYRLVCSQLDYDKLVLLGIPGLRKEVRYRLADPSLDASQTDFLESLNGLLDLLTDILKAYEAELDLKIRESSENENYRLIRSSVHNLQESAPSSLHEAMQLVWLYSILAGSRDFGRMDVYFGDLYVHDIDAGIITHEEAVQYLLSFYRLMHDMDSRDGRIVMGGLGRRNPGNADRFSLICMEAGQIFHELKPEFSLRMYKEMSEDVRAAAMDMLKSGMTYPLLFNDEASMKAVQRNMHLSEEESKQYGFFGCGEYVIGHASMGTPNDIINLAKALEITLHEGIDPITHKPHGLNLGPVEDFDTFDKLFDAYKKQVEYFTSIAARHQRLVYDTVRSSGAMLLMSLLMDDCIRRAKPAISGGIRHLAGTYETYGNITVSDSLLAIKKSVYEEKRFTLRELVDLLDQDYKGHEKERILLLNYPKFGNDLPEADSMAHEVNNHIFDYTASQAEVQGLSSYLVVVINNGANTDLGRNTLATADGRHAFTYLSNGNNPMAGMDTNGLPALLRSIASTEMVRTAGTAQNLKLSRELFENHAEIVHQLIDTCFDMGILSLNISVMNKGDMEDALVHPESHQNLFIRVGGFSARFIDLDPGTQQDVLHRSIY